MDFSFIQEWLLEFHAMNVFYFWGLLIITIIVFVLLFLNFIYFLMQFFIIKKTQISPVGMVNPGYIACGGVALSSETPTLISPITKTPCCFYRYTISTHSTFTKSSVTELLVKGESSNFFLLDDGTGLCAISPTGAEIVSHVDTINCKELPTDILFNPSIMSDPNYNRLTHIQLKKDESFELKEEYIKHEECVYVIGSLTRHRYTDKNIFVENLVPLDMPMMQSLKSLDKGFTFQMVLDELNQRWSDFIRHETRFNSVNLISMLALQEAQPFVISILDRANVIKSNAYKSVLYFGLSLAGGLFLALLLIGRFFI